MYFESKALGFANVQVREESRMMLRFLAQVIGRLVISFIDLGNTIKS